MTSYSSHSGLVLCFIMLMPMSCLYLFLSLMVTGFQVAFPCHKFFFQTARDEETLAAIQKCFVTWHKLTSTQKYLLPITRIKHITLPFSQYIPSTFFYFSLTRKPEDYQPHPYFTSAGVMSISCLLPDRWSLSCLLEQLAPQLFSSFAQQDEQVTREEAGRQVCNSP